MRAVFLEARHFPASKWQNASERCASNFKNVLQIGNLQAMLYIYILYICNNKQMLPKRNEGGSCVLIT